MPRAIGIGIGVNFGGRALPSFSPLDLSPALWLDAADTATITESGGSVSQWNDKSGNARNFTQASGTAQPTTGTRTQNGLNVIDFDGTTDFLEGGDVLDILSGGVTLFVVTKLDTAPTTGLTSIVGKSKAATGSGRYTIFWNLPEGGHAALFQDTADRLAANDPGSSNRTNVFVLASRIVRNSAITLWRNGSVVATNSNLSGTTSYNSTDVWMIGAYQAANGVSPASGSFMDGFIAEVVVFMRDLTNSEMADMNTYLQSKWNV
jgi:hypothetical protein